MKKARFVTSARGGAAGFSCRAALLIFALVLTGCEFLQDLIFGGEGTEPENPESAPRDTSLASVFSNGSDPNEGGSAIDLIQEAKRAGRYSLVILLQPSTESKTVDLRMENTDIGNGLILAATDIVPSLTTVSPAKVTMATM